MSPKNKDDRAQEPKVNSQLKSSIVHKPFATGTVNIFNPHRQKGNANSQLAAPKLYLNAELEKSEPSSLTDFESEPAEVEYHEGHWLEGWLNSWSITAISIILLANIVSGAVIWRNVRMAAKIKPVSPTATLGSTNIATEEFMPLNLGTLSRLKTAEDIEEPSVIEPIAPALAPINLAQSNIDPEYYYILLEYRGDASLARARQKIKQVSLVNLPQGVFIYLGAYKDRDEANLFVAHLEQSNLAAQIYPFD